MTTVTNESLPASNFSKVVSESNLTNETAGSSPHNVSVEDQQATIDAFVLKLNEAKGDDRKIAADALAKEVQKLDAAIVCKMLNTFHNTHKAAREGVFMAIAAIANSDKTPAYEAALVDLLPLIFSGCGKKGTKAEADAAELACIAVAKIINPYAIRFVLPTLFTGAAKDQTWKTRQVALDVIGTLATTGPECMGECLPIVVPELGQHVHDTRAQVKDAARSALTKCLEVVGNPDIEHVTNDLVNAMIDPKQVVAVIHKLSGTTFVRSVTVPTLAILVPLLVRGLNEGQTATKRQTAKIIANMSKLVDEPTHSRPFMPLLLPALEAASSTVSDPEARNVCAEAHAQLDRLNAACEKAPPQAVVDLSDVAEILRTSLGDLISDRDGLTLSYICSCISSLVSMKAWSSDDWEEALLSLVQGVTGSAPLAEQAIETSRLRCEAMLDVQHENEDEDDDVEELCNCKFTLAYGTKILLHNTEMRLKRGFRYGLLGANDSGKTTLMRSIANGQVEGFPDPSEVRTVFVEADIQGELSQLCCLEYILADDRIKNCGASEDEVAKVLSSVGFTDKMQSDPVTTLSGGWRMKLALARAMLQKADILLMDEPTNHLDVINVAWVKSYLLNLKDVTCIIVSHDAGLLDDVCTHILEINSFKLSLHKGNLSAFVEKHPSARAFFEMKAVEKKFRFPQPGRIEGVKRKGRALMKMEKVEFTYPCNTKPTITGVTVQVSLASRVAVLGVNGAGKSTLIKVLTGEMEPSKGSVWKHPNCRVAYVAQHAFHHIEKHLDKTANQYIQWRYQNNEDKESLDKVTMALTAEEEEKTRQPVEWILKDEESGKSTKVKRVIDFLTGGRRLAKDKSQEYEVKWEMLDMMNNTFIPAATLVKWGFSKHMSAVDQKISARDGAYFRPLTTANVEQHLEDVGLETELGTHTLMGALSGGQKVKVVLAAAMWMQPHVLILDEPTNYLDRESLGALAGAIEEFEGGVVMITHNNEFCSALCPEKWVMENGMLDLQGDPEWMANAAKEALDQNVEIQELVDGAGNAIKIESKSKKELSRKEKKAKMRALKAKVKNGEELTESEDEFLLAGDDA